MKRMLILLTCIVIATLQSSCCLNEEKREQLTSDFSDYNKEINKVLNKSEETKKTTQSKKSQKPLTAKDYKKKGLEEARSGNNKEAIKLYTQAIKLDPKYALAYNNRCAAKIELDQFESAIKDCNAAMKYNPKLAMAVYNRARASFLRGDYEEALIYHKKYEEMKGKRKD